MRHREPYLQEHASGWGGAGASVSAQRTAGIMRMAAAQSQGGRNMCTGHGRAAIRRQARLKAQENEAEFWTQGAQRAAASRVRPSAQVEPRLLRARRSPPTRPRDCKCPEPPHLCPINNHTCSQFTLSEIVTDTWAARIETQHGKSFLKICVGPSDSQPFASNAGRARKGEKLKSPWPGRG